MIKIEELRLLGFTFNPPSCEVSVIDHCNFPIVNERFIDIVIVIIDFDYEFFLLGMLS